MSRKSTHLCYPMHVAGVLRATCTDHFWQPITQPAASERVTR